MAMAIKLIIFDFDGTLGNTRRNIVTTMQQTMQECGLPVADESTCAATIGLKLSDCFRHIYPTMTAAEADKCASVYRRIFEEVKKKLIPELFPNVHETLRRLKERGYVLTVASSRSSLSLRGLLDDMNIADSVSYIVGADDVTMPKPNPEPVLKTLHALGYTADETLVVGDMPVDILMGANAGAHTCGVTYGNASRQQLEESGAEFIIDDMAELPDILCP